MAEPDTCPTPRPPEWADLERLAGPDRGSSSGKSLAGFLEVARDERDAGTEEPEPPVPGVRPVGRVDGRQGPDQIATALENARLNAVFARHYDIPLELATRIHHHANFVRVGPHQLASLYAQFEHAGRSLGIAPSNRATSSSGAQNGLCGA